MYAREFTVKPGEMLDLGDILIEAAAIMRRNEARHDGVNGQQSPNDESPGVDRGSVPADEFSSTTREKTAVIEGQYWAWGAKRP